MNKFLDEMFEGVPKDYASDIFFNLIYPSVQQGMMSETPPEKFELDDNTGLTEKQKEKALNSVKKLYSFGYSLGMYANGLAGNPRLSDTKIEISLDAFTSAMEKITKIVGNAVYYFNPEGFEGFIRDTQSDIGDLVGYGRVLRKKDRETIQ